MIDWSKPIDKTDPRVLAEWASELRKCTADERKTGWCPALSDIEELCAKAEASLALSHLGRAASYLDEAAYHWYRMNK